MAKMRLLTFMGMAVEFKEISFDTMQQELQIGADDVEAFVIDGTRTSSQINLSCLPLLSVLLATNGGEKKGSDWTVVTDSSKKMICLPP